MADFHASLDAALDQAEVAERQRVATEQRRLQREYIEHLEAEIARLAPPLARVRALLRYEYVSRLDLYAALTGADR